MATITGFTAARTAAIEANTIVSGTINGSNHLILTKHDGSTVDAGFIEPGGLTLGTAQTITGAKTFNAGAFLDKGSNVYNVKAYGAVGNGTTDDTAAIQAAVDAAQAAGGGTVWFPRATYKISVNPIKLYSGVTPTITSYSNIKLLGAGATIAQATNGVDIIRCVNDVANGAVAFNNTIEGFTLTFSGTPTNSGNGIYLAQQAAGGPLFRRWNIRNVLVSNCQAAGTYAFKAEGIITSTVERVQTNDCLNGFYLNGQVTGQFTSPCSSVTFLNCRVNMITNGNAFRVVNSTNITYISCFAAYTANSTGTAYLVEGSNAVVFEACGFDLSGGVTLTTGFKIAADAGANPSAQVVVTSGFCFQSKNTKEVWVTGNSKAVLIAFQSNSSVSGSTGLTVDGGSSVSEQECGWPVVGTARTLAATAIWRTPGVVRVQGINASATPTPAAGITDFLFVGNAAAAMTVGAPTGVADDGQVIEIWYRDNGAGVRTIAHNAIFVNGPANMVTTTVAGKNVREIFQYSIGANQWVCMTSSPAGW